jgi:glutamyl-tRNA synthetase
MSDATVRVRFAPSPTGYLHIGGARTALFNWLIARKTGGRFVLRIEDTDRTRHVEGAVEKILDDLRWLGLDFDEGPEVGGDHGPYFQSQRLELYTAAADKLLADANAYYAFDTPEELSAMREAARREKRPLHYPRPDPLPTRDDADRARADGKPVVVRFKMPGTDITVDDQILGEVTLSRDEMEDFIICKADGWPTYHLACVVDDEQMRITDVLRGQEHLMNTPKHIALQRALDYRTPRYAHMPLIFNADGSKMSKRDKEKAEKMGLTPPEIDVHDFRVAGYLPEALINFVALLGWSPSDDREKFTAAELTEVFEVSRIGKAAAKFDRDKLLAFNTQAAADADADRLLAGLKDYIAVAGSPLTGASDEVLREVLRVSAGFRTFRDVEAKCGFLFVDDAAIAYDPAAVKKVLHKGENAGLNMLGVLAEKFAAVEPWTAESLETLFKAVQEEHDVGMGKVAQPVRVAVTGSTVSPAIYDTLLLLGRARTQTRLERAIRELTPV